MYCAHCASFAEGSNARDEAAKRGCWPSAAVVVVSSTAITLSAHTKGRSDAVDEQQTQYGHGVQPHHVDENRWMRRLLLQV